MTFVKFLFYIGCSLCVPIVLLTAIRVTEFLRWWWKESDWEERVENMVYAGMVVLIVAGMLKAIITQCDSSAITADASTDTQQEIPPQVENCRQEEPLP